MHPQNLLFSDILKLNKQHTHSLYIGLNLHGGNVSDLKIEGGEDPKDYHVTLLWGKFTPRSDIDDTVCRIQSVMKEIQNDIPERTVFYHERRFEASQSSDGKDVIVAAATGGELEQAHKKVLDVLKKEGITVEKTFPTYVPHLTLAYIEPGAEHELRVLDHSADVKDITVCIKRLDTNEKEYERVFGMVAKSFSHLMKFNPYHDRLGRFSGANGAASFTYKPGASTAHNKAIERAKAQSEADAGKGFKGTLYHGSPNTDIKEFDMKRAGQNTSSGEKLLFFTDNKQMADDFSYERLEGSSKFFQKRGKKGRVYEVDVEMKNPLDLRKLSDKDIDNILKLDEDGILTKQDVQRYAQSNHQLLKAGLTLTSESLKGLGYDGLIANTGKAGHNSLEYAVVDSKQAKIRKSNDMNEQGSLSKSSFLIHKADEEKRLVFGWALVSATTDGQQIIDLQGDVVNQDDLEEGAYEYVLNFRDAGEEHIGSLRKKARMVESVVFTEEKMQAIGIPPGTIPIGWWIGFYVDDDATWEKIKDGTYTMFSIEGKAVREPIKEPLTKSIAKSFSELVEKFNPYHDSKGRFTTAGTATSFTYKPGQGKMYDNAIAREKERHAQETSAAAPPKKYKVKRPKEETPRVKEIKKVEDKIRNQNFESAAVIDSEGNTLFFKDGQRSQVGFSRLECMQMANNTLTHNHPRCSMFSPEDLNCMITNNMQEIRATNRDGTTYSMRRADGGFIASKAIDFVGVYASEYPNSNKFAQKELDRRGFQDKIWKGEITHDEANQEFGRVTAKYMAEFAQKTASQYGLVFTVEHASVSKSFWREVMYADIEKGNELVLDRDTNDAMDQAFNEWLEKHGLSEKGKVAKSFSELMKFNPYHDRLGRFATSSGYASFTLRTKDPSKQHMADMAVAREKDKAVAASGKANAEKIIADQENKLKSILRDGAQVNLKGVDPELAESTVKNIEMVINRYPGTKDAYAGFTTDDPEPGYFNDKKGVMACYSTSTKMIHLNQKYYSDKEAFEKRYKESIDKKHSPEGTTVDSVVVHEMGHAIDRYLSLETMDIWKVNWGGDSVSTRLWNNNIKNAEKKGTPLTSKDITDGLSRYATKNAAEYFAEGFAEFMTSSSPRPMAQKVGKHMEIYYKKAQKAKGN